jgi:superfamily II DNA or RNA helicase
MTEFLFTKADIEANFDARDLSHGRAYWQRGAVQDLKVQKNGCELTAKVRGTKPRPYIVSVSITPLRPKRSGGFTRTTLIPECSCPIGYGCKHAAAVCFEALAQQQSQHSATLSTIGDELTTTIEGGTGPIQDIIASLPPHMRATIKTPQKATDPTEVWLDALEKKVKADNSSERGRKHKSILYILDVADDDAYHIHHQTRLQPIMAPILKNRRYGTPQNVSLSQLSKPASYITAEDRTIGQLMRGAEAYGNDLRSPPIAADFFDLVMQRVISTGRCFLDTHKGFPLTLGGEKKARLGWQMQSDGMQAPAILAEEDQAQFFVLPAARPWYVDKSALKAGPLVFDAPLSVVHKFLEGPKLSPAGVTAIAQKLAARSLPAGITLPREIVTERRKAVPPMPCLRLVSTSTSIGAGEDRDHIHHLALLHFEYDGVVIDPNAAPEVMQWQTGNRVITQARDREAESKFIHRLIEKGEMSPSYVRPAGIPRARLSYAFNGSDNERLSWLDFIHREVSALRAEGWRIEIDEDFDKRFQAIELDQGDDVWQADMHEKEGSAWWFSLDLGIMVKGQRVALLPLLVQAIRKLREPSMEAIKKLAISGKFYVEMQDGCAVALPFERVRDILTTLVELYDQPLNADGSLTVSLDLAMALSRIDAATHMRWLGGKRLKTLVDRLKNFSGLAEVQPPHGLTAILRPYQREGLNWLQFLRDYGLGGILADDMGLGKTVQTLAHILIEKDAKRLDRPCLIVCPTSLIPNWQDEAQKFAPELTVLPLHGKERAQRFSEISKADLVLTTYALLPRDVETLLPVEWHMVVLDEAQAIKNPATKVTQLVCELKTRHRLCLTGTPIENHLGEVWSHFAFLMPGILGTHKDFTKRFRMPIEKQRDTERQALLARRLKPFVLRRNKTDVAKELPPKTEIIQYVEFEQAQRDLYETLRLTMNEKVQEAVSTKGFNRSRIVILDALLKLRQACCDPRLVKLAGAHKAKHSAKLDNLMEMLPEMIEEGRRILLFSQFTSMLDLIKLELDKTKIPYVEIRGDTIDRKTPVQRFQNCEVPLFLISLKAGGTGLNLTAADTVIHYDPWWNPAVENQATDRAHRIGQDKSVFVYKFIVKGTVEERILDLQKRKRSLASALLDERSEATVAFEANDLDFLLRPMA